jgi:CRP-like cAMP-binding protein
MNNDELIKQSKKKVTEEYIINDEEMIEILKNDYRAIDESKKVMGYLKNMNDFVEILKRQNENYKETLINISYALQYVYLPEYKVLFRYGEKGDAFYIILKGRVNVIIPNQKEYILSKEEYIEYLCLLSHYGEKELLAKCLEMNKYITNVTENEIRDYMFRNRKKYPVIEDHLTVDYSEKVKPFVTGDPGDKRKPLQVFTFHHVKQLKTGDIFGDLALDNNNNKRTATIVSDSDCHFGTIIKSVYVKSIQDTNTKFKKNNIAFIMSTPFFQGVTNKLSLYHFQKMCVNAFTIRRVERKEYIIKENDEPINLFFIKSGQFEICMNKSVMEINELIRHFGGTVEDDLNEYEVIYEDAKFYNFMVTKKYSRVIYILLYISYV